MEEMIGQSIGSYTIERFIGEGGMGTVWLGKHSTIGRQVAIKMLHPQYGRNEKIRERFRREAATLARLQHPNIVTLYDYIETGQNLCLVMEYVQGMDLEQVVRSKTGPLPTDRLGRIFRQILAAIGYAHSQGVVHRDIKPSNFMLTADDEVKVLDFGIAKLLDDGQQLTRTGMRLGTTGYMSPEQVQGQGVDHRSDIYSLGVTLFFLATGQSPYHDGMSEFQVYSKIVQEPLPAARSVYPGVGEGVERMIQIATAKNPKDRFQTAGDFLTHRGPAPMAGGSSSQQARPQSAPNPYPGNSSIVAARSSYGSSVQVFSIIALVLFLFHGVILIAGPIGTLLKKSWGMWITRVVLILMGLFWALVGIAGMSSTRSNDGDEIIIAICFGIFAFCVWGIYLMFHRESKNYFK